MALDIDTLLSNMLNAALPILKKAAPGAESFAKAEFTKIAQTIESLGQQLAAKEITAQQATLLLSMQTSASRNVLLTLEGLGLLAVESAINAALGVVKAAVNGALGIALIA